MIFQSNPFGGASSKLVSCRLKGASGQGFTLIETVLALSLVSFALVGLMGLLPVGLSITAETLQKSAANQIATQLIRAYQQANYSSLSSNQAKVYYYTIEGEACQITDKWFYKVDASTNLAVTVDGKTQQFFGVLTLKISAKNKKEMNFTASLADRGT